MTTSSRKPTRGQALLEFALGVTVLLLFVGGIIDVGRVYFAYQIVSEAAREGVIYASMAADQENAIKQRAVNSTSTLPLSTDDVTVSYTGERCGNNGNEVSVTVQYRLPLHMPMTMAILGSEVTIRATEQAIILAPACP